MQETLGKIWSKFDEASLLSEELQKLGLEECLIDLESISDDKRDDDYFYLKGYILYMITPPRISEAQACFERALEIYPENNGARLYLGHCLYDTGFYEKAEYHFSIVDKDVFNDFFQMKIEEMLVCCRIKLSGLNEQNLFEARQLINKYRKVNYHDDYLFSLSKVLKDFNMDINELAVKDLKFRQAAREDLPEIVRMLADDFLGAQRERYENPLPESYLKAFAEIEADKNNELIVAILSEPGAVATGSNDSGLNLEEKLEPQSDFQNSELGKPVATAPGSDTTASEIIVGTLQITFTPSISFQGGKRATVESVRVDAKYRGQSIGKELMKWAIERARQEGCVSMQLTTNMERTDAHRFYENLGFKKSHLGMKLNLK